MSSFRYAEDQRADIVALAPRKLTDKDWEILEGLAVDYRKALPPMPASKALQIGRTAQKLAQQLKTLLVPDNPNRWPEIPAALNSLEALQAWVKPYLSPKSQRKKSNRARPDILDRYLVLLVMFFQSCGGHPGKAPSSPCARFVIAATTPVLDDLTPGAIAGLIRSRLWLLAVDLETAPPQIGAPELGIPPEHGN